MQTYKLELTTRESGKNAAKEVRNKNAIGVVYGHGLESTPVQGDWTMVNKLLYEAGTSHIIQVVIDDDKPREAVLKDTDFDPVTNQLRHFDLYVVKKGEKIHADVPIEVVGDAPASRVGLLVHQLLDSIEVVTLPASLPESFVVEISNLAEVGDTIYVSDISVPEGVEIAEELLEQPVIKVDAPREEEEEPEPVDEELSPEDIPSEHGGDSEEQDESGDDDSSSRDESKPSEDKANE